MVCRNLIGGCSQSDDAVLVRCTRLQAYNFMLLAMREYSGPDPSKPTIQPTQPGQETFESWAKERLVVGEERAGIFYETDHFGRPLRVDINGRLRQLRHYIWSFLRISQHCTIPPCDDALYPVPMRIGAAC